MSTEHERRLTAEHYAQECRIAADRVSAPVLDRVSAFLLDLGDENELLRANMRIMVRHATGKCGCVRTDDCHAIVKKAGEAAR